MGGVYWPANLNSYGYVANNPVKYVDEDGEFIWLPIIIGGVVGAVAAGTVAATTQKKPTLWSVGAAALGGGVTGALGGLPLATYTTFGGGMATGVAWNAAVAGPVGWSLGAVAAEAGRQQGEVVQEDMPTASGLAGSMAGGLAPGLSGPLSRKAGAAVASSADDAMDAIGRSLAAENVVDSGVSGAIHSGTQTALDAGGRSTAGVPSDGSGPAKKAGASGAANPSQYTGPSIRPSSPAGAQEERALRRFYDNYGPSGED